MLHVVGDVPPLVVLGAAPARTHVFGIDRLGKVKAAIADRLLSEAVIVDVFCLLAVEVPLAHDARSICVGRAWRVGPRGEREREV